jgi:predicted RNase H-like nuclease (RuvC/YqgF family)
MQRLESMLKELGEIPVDDDEDDNATVELREPHPASCESHTTLAVRTGPITPPTPAESTEPQMPTHPVVRITMHALEAMGRDLEALKEEKQAFEVKIARLEKQQSPPRVNREEELQTEIGHLKYQNEQNKTQKATMARTLSQKDVEIKQLQLNLDASREALETAVAASKVDHFQAQLRDYSISSSRELSELTKAKDRDIRILTQQLNDLQEVVRRSEEGSHNNNNNNNNNNNKDKDKALAEARLEALNRCEKQLKSVNAKYAVEHARVNELEDHVEGLQGRLNQIGDLQAQLSQKSADCDRWRTKYKNQERMVENWKRQIERTADENTCLRGAAHLVKPVATSKLSPLVLGCSECYAKNINCDNKARCRHCTENNEDCARWRCSLRHHLGQCPRVPCTFPHEEDGWLLAPEPRPQW